LFLREVLARSVLRPCRAGRRGAPVRVGPNAQSRRPNVWRLLSSNSREYHKGGRVVCRPRSGALGRDCSWRGRTRTGSSIARPAKCAPHPLALKLWAIDARERDGAGRRRGWKMYAAQSYATRRASVEYSSRITPQKLSRALLECGTRSHEKTCSTASRQSRLQLCDYRGESLVESNICPDEAAARPACSLLARMPTARCLRSKLDISQGRGGDRFYASSNLEEPVRQARNIVIRRQAHHHQGARSADAAASSCSDLRDTLARCSPRSPDHMPPRPGTITIEVPIENTQTSGVYEQKAASASAPTPCCITISARMSPPSAHQRRTLHAKKLYRRYAKSICSSRNALARCRALLPIDAIHHSASRGLRHGRYSSSKSGAYASGRDEAATTMPRRRQLPRNLIDMPGDSPSPKRSQGAIHRRRTSPDLLAWVSSK